MLFGDATFFFREVKSHTTRGLKALAKKAWRDQLAKTREKTSEKSAAAGLNARNEARTKAEKAK